MSVPPLPSHPASSKAAVASLICGLGGFLTGPVTGLPAIITGHIGLGNIKRSAGQLTGGSMAIAGLVMGYITTILYPIIIIIAAITGVMAPEILRKRDRADELRVSRHLYEFHDGFTQFHAVYSAYPNAATYEKRKGDPAVDPANPLTQLRFSSPLNELLEVPKSASGSWYYFPGAEADAAHVLIISPGLKGGKYKALLTDRTVKDYSVIDVGEALTGATTPPVLIAPVPQKR